MMLKNKIMKLQTYKMFEDEDTVYVERDDVLKLLEQQPCEDCISREEVKNEIRRWIGYLDEDMIFRINVGIDRLPSVTPWPVWIPVSEKLPEPLTAVLLTVRYKSTGHWTYQIGYWEDALEKWEKWLEIGTLDDEFEILAWMELPEIYEEDNNEW